MRTCFHARYFRARDFFQTRDFHAQNLFSRAGLFSCRACGRRSRAAHALSGAHPHAAKRLAFGKGHDARRRRAAPSKERIRIEIVSDFHADAALTLRKKRGFSVCSVAGSRSRDYPSNPHFQCGIAQSSRKDRVFPTKRQTVRFGRLRVPNGKCEAAAQRRPAQTRRNDRVFSAKRQAVCFETQSVPNGRCSMERRRQGSGKFRPQPAGVVPVSRGPMPPDPPRQSGTRVPG